MNEAPQQDPTLDRLRGILGLKQDATAESALQAVEKMKRDETVRNANAEFHGRIRGIMAATGMNHESAMAVVTNQQIEDKRQAEEAAAREAAAQELANRKAARLARSEEAQTTTIQPPKPKRQL